MHLAAEWRSRRLLHDMVQDVEAAKQRVPLPQGDNVAGRERKGPAIQVPVAAAVHAPLAQARRCTQFYFVIQDAGQKLRICGACQNGNGG